MKNLDSDYVLSDKFLIELKKKLKNNHQDGFICSKNCPLLKTRYAGICMSWMNEVLRARNITDPYRRYTPISCRELFTYVFKHALDIDKKQNKI